MGSVTRRMWFILLAAVSLAAWVALVIGAKEVLSPALCATRAFWTTPPPTSPDLLLVLNGPTTVMCSAALMVAAMMLPLIPAPLRHVHERSFTRRRGRAMLLFVAGYAILWVCAVSGLQLLALAARWIAPTSLVFLVAAAAALWQASPGKQWFLNRCHRRPQLAAFGVAADRDALVFGLTHGASCAGACWGLMLLSLSVANLHLPVMAAVALFAAAERVERPAPLVWQWRWPGKALRIAAVQLRLRSSQLPLAGSSAARISVLGGAR
jgi:predicted metal-binding membrane protein